jgi:hypothetical protein
MAELLVLWQAVAPVFPGVTTKAGRGTLTAAGNHTWLTAACLDSCQSCVNTIFSV